jgi:hypothetical protein
MLSLTCASQQPLLAAGAVALQATSCFRGRLQTAGKGSALALVAQGLMMCGCDPEPWLVNELIAASSPKVPRMDINSLQTLAQVGVVVE